MPLARKTEKRFTYQDYITWQYDEKWELIDGIAYNMSPAPSIEHQRIVRRFSNILDNNLQNTQCEPFLSPTDVVLTEYDVVQPDIFVVCDGNKIKEKNIQGAPDLVIEVLSPSTAFRDRFEKRELYEKYGVKEYIIVDIIEQLVERFNLGKRGIYGKSDIFTPDKNIKLLSLNKMKISLPEVFGIKVVSENEDKPECS